jgi:hypothetical protein
MPATQATLAAGMARAFLVCALLCLALAPAARAQTTNPFTPQLPPPSQSPVATPTPTATSAQDSGNTGRTTLLVIGGALLVGFAVMAFFIARDARRSLPEDKRPKHALRDELAHSHKRQAKARARQKAKAQRAARRRNRPA